MRKKNDYSKVRKAVVGKYTSPYPVRFSSEMPCPPLEDLGGKVTYLPKKKKDGKQ